MSENNPAVMATTKAVRTTVDGGMTVTFDIAPEDVQKAFLAFGNHGTAVAIVPVTKQASQADARTKTVERERKGFLDQKRSQQAFLRCREPGFWQFLTDSTSWKVQGEDDARRVVCSMLGITSRSQLDDPLRGASAKGWDDIEADYYAHIHGRH